MKGHKKQKCGNEETLEFSDGSTYIGTVYDGKPSGRGRLIVSVRHTYVGEFLDGKRHGVGVQRLPAGIVYDGHWRNGHYHGHGTLRTSDTTYTGGFYHGKYHGHGEFRGEGVYSGKWAHGNKHGTGTLTDARGTYEGTFYHNLKHGTGVQTYVDGSVYSGSWRSSQKHGLGVMTREFETYTGDWLHDKRSGYGRWESKYLGSYEGHWKRGVRHKRGTHTYTDGSVYKGCWNLGRRTGHGVMQFADGSTYRGFWFQDEMHGRGMLKEPCGHTFEGEWSSGDREGMFTETKDGETLAEGPWLCDTRHGSFRVNGKRELYLWDTKTSFKSTKHARKAVTRMMKKKDALSAEEVLRFYPELIKWSLFEKHDRQGILVHMLPQQTIDKMFRRCAYKFFRKKRFKCIERMYGCCSESLQAQIVEHAELLFDAMTREFVANPWVVGTVGYSSTTKEKLLKGLHLGEYGRCEPRNPYTRQNLNEQSGAYLNTMKIAQSVYTKVCNAVPKSIHTLAFEFEMQDFERLLRNARAANDRDTIKTLINERNEFMKRHRAESTSSDDSRCP